ncbi:MAG TPA: TRC40/GET3/ArsA family transport-energizing ATPase [Thermoanaerobaculia bacterium]|nr:TRC40/GET3/ArsA family transport-energizing ATPase [Thermoanaerobaculia bacterium]
MANDDLPGHFDSLRSRRIVLIGGKGGVGKTTIATAAALHFAETGPAILFTTDPASNLADLFSLQPPAASRRLTLESLDASALYRRFLDSNLASFLEIADRGTYLDRDELRRLFELAMPGIDELMAWMRIGELAEENPEALLVVDTAPTGHTMRMLGASEHFRQLAIALDAMQEKHRAMVFQFTRRDVRDAIDAFIDDFDARAKRRHELLQRQGFFVPVTLREPLVIEQTLRLIDEVGLDVPFVVLNRARGDEPEVRERFAPRDVGNAMRACVPLDSAERIRDWMRGVESRAAEQPALPAPSRPSRALPAGRRLLFFAGKGGVGKTTTSASVALRLATRNPDQRYVILSVDPAHSLRDLFARLTPPANLAVEAIDTRAKWRRFRDSLGHEIADAFDALTPRGMTLAHDSDAMRQLLEIAPPGADELFAITRLAELIADASIDGIVVDTAPTGHFLRLLDLPRTAGEWVREFMRLLLRYKELIPAGSLGEELVHASRSLKELDAALHGERASVIVVTRPERIVVAETRRLLETLRERAIPVGAVIANYVTPENGDACDQSMRGYELAALEAFPDAILIERRDQPPLTLESLVTLIPKASLPS